MKKSEYLLKTFIHAAGVFLYVLAISLFLFNAEKIFGVGPDSFLAPLFMLLLFIVSALITGLLVLGRPIYLYLGGQKKEAFIFLFYTTIWLFLFIIMIAGALALK